MNERIKELAREAEGEFYISCGNQVPTWYFQYNTLEKFAELIVRECCFTGEQYADGLIDSKHYAFVNKKIKEHFGVEE